MMTRPSLASLYKKQSYFKYDVRLDGSELCKFHQDINMAELPQLIFMHRIQMGRNVVYEVLVLAECGLRTLLMHGANTHAFKCAMNR